MLLGLRHEMQEFTGRVHMDNLFFHQEQITNQLFRLQPVWRWKWRVSRLGDDLDVRCSDGE
jgi:hypothetical protein